jgi:hypothetical protein
VNVDWRKGTIEKLRSLILMAEPDIVEEAKWRKASNPEGVPTFSSAGLVCTVETYQDKVKLTFARGAALDDPSGLFNAGLDGGTRRAIDPHARDALDDHAFVELVRKRSPTTAPEPPVRVGSPLAGAVVVTRPHAVPRSTSGQGSTTVRPVPA